MIRVQVEPRLAGTPFGVAFLGLAFAFVVTAVPVSIGVVAAEWGPVLSWGSTHGVLGVVAWLPVVIWVAAGLLSLRTVVTYIRVYVLFTMWVTGRPAGGVVMPVLLIALVSWWVGEMLASPALTHYAESALSVLGPAGAMFVAAVWTLGWYAGIALGAPIDSAVAAAAVVLVVERSLRVDVADGSAPFGPTAPGQPSPGGQVVDEDPHGEASTK